MGRYAKLDKPSFMGREALLEIQSSGCGRSESWLGWRWSIAALRVTAIRCARRLMERRIGEVTSGSPAPFLKKNIATGLCAGGVRQALDTELVAVEIRGQHGESKV